MYGDTFDRRGLVATPSCVPADRGILHGMSGSPMDGVLPLCCCPAAYEDVNDDCHWRCILSARDPIPEGGITGPAGRRERARPRAGCGVLAIYRMRGHRVYGSSLGVRSLICVAAVTDAPGSPVAHAQQSPTAA